VAGAWHMPVEVLTPPIKSKGVVIWRIYMIRGYDGVNHTPIVIEMAIWKYISMCSMGLKQNNICAPIVMWKWRMVDYTRG